VGDIVAVHQGKEVPADLCFIHSPTNNAFLDTSNIDGETGL
jgi:magnesium-transporting ATPase (P-type)